MKILLILKGWMGGCFCGVDYFYPFKRLELYYVLFSKPAVEPKTREGNPE